MRINNNVFMPLLTCSKLRAALRSMFLILLGIYTQIRRAHPMYNADKSKETLALANQQ
jgi:predicted transporter